MAQDGHFFSTICCCLQNRNIEKELQVLAPKPNHKILWKLSWKNQIQYLTLKPLFIHVALRNVLYKLQVPTLVWVTSNPKSSKESFPNWGYFYWCAQNCKFQLLWCFLSLYSEEVVPAAVLPEFRKNLDNSIRHMMGFWGLSSVGPGVGLTDSCRTFPAEDILGFQGSFGHQIMQRGPTHEYHV